MRGFLTNCTPLIRRLYNFFSSSVFMMLFTHSNKPLRSSDNSCIHTKIILHTKELYLLIEGLRKAVVLVFLKGIQVLNTNEKHSFKQLSITLY